MAKELRLMRSAGLAALVMTLAPLFLGGLWVREERGQHFIWLVLFYGACMLPTMELFGREFDSGTFGLLMGQPDPSSTVIALSPAKNLQKWGVFACFKNPSSKCSATFLTRELLCS
jgi:ABC-type transport system involved in cytochrome c biogenesis permease component